ncbi:chemotaxis protein CheW [Chondrinema litorale]|uniref:chemotaxis protein CheW n=1 Tax=Chondrinema litorale TaxID=2994555 RepID=UPI0025435DB2|nr:chemotaxis protein CheW [Chondrinema litorale]UZR95190.1 chemotaxis protein CheW [Chondrinema litorale]
MTDNLLNKKELFLKKDKDNGQEEHVDRSQIVVFKLGGEEYAMMIDEIKEVVVTPNIAKIPLMPSYIKGVANVRGNILAVLDLEEKFGLMKEEKDKNKKNYILVVESDKYKMAILVQEVPNTLNILDSQIDNSPNVVIGEEGDKDFIKGLVRLENRLIILLDIFSIVSKDILQAGSEELSA